MFSMNLQVTQISDKKDFDKYLSLVESFDVINPFYKILGASLDEHAFDELHYFTLLDSNETVLILMPFFLRRIPYLDQDQVYFDVISPYVYSGPLYNYNMSRGYLIRFWELVDTWYKTHHVVSEFMRFSLNHNHQFYSGTLVPSLSNVKGKLLDPETQWDLFKQKVRNNYRKGQGSGLQAKFYTQEAALEQLSLFYDIYLATMSRIDADSSYFYSYHYFKSILTLSDENAYIVLVYKDDVPISTELILIDGTTLYSFLGGTLADYFQYRPNDFLKIEVMRWAYGQGYEYYLLGGGRLDGDTLYQYKKSFFPDDEDAIYYTGRKIINQAQYDYLNNLLNTPVILDEPINGGSDNPHFFPAYRRFQLKKD